MSDTQHLAPKDRRGAFAVIPDEFPLHANDRAAWSAPYLFRYLFESELLAVHRTGARDRHWQQFPRYSQVTVSPDAAF